jgi:hypothetical protein
MKLHPITFIVSALFAGSIAQAAELSNQLLPKAAGDQVPARLQTITSAKSAGVQLDRASSSMSWAIDPQVALDARPAAFIAESREYWIDAKGSELQRGVSLSTTSKGAVIRISPRVGSMAIASSTLSIAAAGKRYAAADALSAAANEDELRAAGMDVPQGSIVVKLKDNIAAGHVELVAAAAEGDYLIHVFEPSSSVVLSVQAAQDTVLAGEPIQFKANIAGGAKLNRLSGLISSPSGHSQPVEFSRQADGSFLASVKPDAARAGGHGLWELHAFGNASLSKLDVQRDARTAFAVSVASARLDGTLASVPSRGKSPDVSMRIGIEAGSASRYQLAGVLYGTSEDGMLRPAVVAHSAAWLQVGKSSIDLKFDAEQIAKSGVKPPYEVRDLRLIDQADMSLIERRERAAALN